MYVYVATTLITISPIAPVAVTVKFILYKSHTSILLEHHILLKKGIIITNMLSDWGLNGALTKSFCYA